MKAEKEARQRGTISSSVYKDYFLAGASVPVLFIALLLMISAQVIYRLPAEDDGGGDLICDQPCVD